MDCSDAGRLGGKARAKKLREAAGINLGGRPKKPTKCPRCGVEQPSARAAFLHCRNGKPGRPRKQPASWRE
jgi:hypothetical protein